MYNDMAPSKAETHIYQPSIEGTKFVSSEEVFQQDFHEHIEVEESLSLEDREKELIKKALEKHRGKRKYAAEELGISERTLYRKIKEYNIQA
jgi:transcriptional regulator with PAS, ATPase and Fis domain